MSRLPGVDGWFCKFQRSMTHKNKTTRTYNIPKIVAKDSVNPGLEPLERAISDYGPGGLLDNGSMIFGVGSRIRRSDMKCK